jgi:hypothetical protein
MNAAIIIDDREDVAKEAIEKHKKFIPSSWAVCYTFNRPMQEGFII